MCPLADGRYDLTGARRPARLSSAMLQVGITL